MKKQFLFIVFVLSCVNVFSCLMIGDGLAAIAWVTAAISSIDHFNTLRKLED
jgi:hypothetical protein